jgi:hypothetical protein
MEMKIEKNFYLLELKNQKKVVSLFDNLDEAVKSVAKQIKEGVPSAQINLSEIELTEDKMLVKGIPWNQILERILKGTD